MVTWAQSVFLSEEVDWEVAASLEGETSRYKSQKAKDLSNKFLESSREEQSRRLMLNTISNERVGRLEEYRSSCRAALAFWNQQLIRHVICSINT
jgi:hypothetical protein